VAITAQAHTERAGPAETEPLEFKHALPRAKAVAPETQRLYAADWAAFSAWCLQHGKASLPATPATVTAYLQSLVGRVGAGALVRRVAALNDRHRSQGHPAPGADPQVAALLRAARQRARPDPDAVPNAAKSSRRVSPSSPAQLARMAALCPSDLAGLRDRALLLLAAAGLDGEQLRSLDYEHVHLTDTGGVELLVLDRAVLDAPGRVLALQRTEPVRACPVRALGDWLLVSACRFGPVFRKVDRWGNLEHRRLGADGLRRIWHRRMQGARRRRAAHASS
jgi:hypothetical protein